MTDETSRPQLAVSAAIFHKDRCLLVQRTVPPRGVYTLPGGRVEFGETVTDAVHREIREETGLTIEIAGLAGWREVLPAMTGGRGHFVILAFAARWRTGDVALNAELAEADWIAPEAVAGLRTTEGLLDIVRTAQRLIG